MYYCYRYVTHWFFTIFDFLGYYNYHWTQCSQPLILSVFMSMHDLFAHAWLFDLDLRVWLILFGGSLCAVYNGLLALDQILDTCYGGGGGTSDRLWSSSRR
jgi:hypothetical protein